MPRRSIGLKFLATDAVGTARVSLTKLWRQIQKFCMKKVKNSEET